MSPSRLLWLIVLAALAAGCSNEDEPRLATDATVVSPAATRAARASPPAGALVHPNGTRTGVAVIDAALSAVEQGDAAALAAMFRFLPRPCYDQPAYDVQCGPGVSPGTLINVIGIARCENSVAQRPTASVLASDFMSDVAGLLYVWQVAGPSAFQLVYDVVFASGHGIFMNDQGVTGLSFPCPARGPIPVPLPVPLGVQSLLPPP